MPFPFTRAGYRALLTLAQESGYTFPAFSRHEDVGPERVCLLRHDVDADIGAALELARIEQEYAISATYFLMLRSPFYNLLARANHAIAKEIRQLGHRIGLHYDIGFRSSNKPIEDSIASEAAFLGETLETPIDAVSFHQPAYALQDPRTISVDGLITAWDLPNFLYLSDANKAPQTRVIYDILREGAYPRLHVLIHPLWWTTDEPESPPEVLWEGAISRNFERMQTQVLETERAFGARRILRIERADE